MQKYNYEDIEMTKTEKKVAEFLDEYKLHWFFESPVYLTDNEGRPRLWTPDFFLPRFGVYIEVWNTRKPEDYRKIAYERNGYHVIFVHAYKEENLWKNYIIRSITDIEKNRYSEVMEMLLDKNLK